MKIDKNWNESTAETYFFPRANRFVGDMLLELKAGNKLSSEKLQQTEFFKGETFAHGTAVWKGFGFASSAWKLNQGNIKSLLSSLDHLITRVSFS